MVIIVTMIYMFIEEVRINRKVFKLLALIALARFANLFQCPHMRCNCVLCLSISTKSFVSLHSSQLMRMSFCGQSAASCH
jgi:hypothetical protein